MKKLKLLLNCLLIVSIVSAQSVEIRLNEAVRKLKDDPQLKHGSMSLYVVNSTTGETIYDWKGQMGLAPASCQKIFTSIAAMDLLGDEYRFKTELGYSGIIKKGILKGNLYITGYGDPTLGSWRYSATKDSVVLDNWVTQIKKEGIRKINGHIYAKNFKFSYQPLPGGWIWNDIGNYYGAGTWALNWHENQYELTLQPGKQEGDEVKIISTYPPINNFSIVNQLKTGKEGSGDNSYIYFPPYSDNGFVEGTIPLQDKPFIISGSFPLPSLIAVDQLANKLIANHISLQSIVRKDNDIDTSLEKGLINIKTFYTNYSPSLDSINYWFLRKSINLYGEALIKAIALEKNGLGNTDSGVAIVKKHWQERGIDESALHIIDGSGLSPQNRITTFSLVTALQYARSRTWFSSFYNALPEYNQMKLKSGTISGAKSFAGYHTAKDGTTYTIAIIINNFDGSATGIVKKMFLVLDQLK